MPYRVLCTEYCVLTERVTNKESRRVPCASGSLTAARGRIELFSDSHLLAVFKIPFKRKLRVTESAHKDLLFDEIKLTTHWAAAKQNHVSKDPGMRKRDLVKRCCDLRPGSRFGAISRRLI